MNATARQIVEAPRATEHLHLAHDSLPDPLWAPLVLRLATHADRRSIERLAQLDSTLPPGGQLLIGELQGSIVAAVSLSDGRVIADPFVASRGILELLALRARQLRPRLRTAA
jgi:hypothetical protein